MQPSNPMQPKGSFTKPPELMKAVAQHEAKPQSAPSPQPQQESEASIIEKINKKVEEVEKTMNPEDAEKEFARQRSEQLLNYKKKIEERLGCVLSEDDMTNYIFRGHIVKEVWIIPNKLKGTFKSHTPKELQQMDILKSQFKEKGNHTDEGLANEHSLLALSYAWTHAAGKSLGENREKRDENIRNMGALVVESAANCLAEFNTLIRIALQEDDLAKKL